jgi:hypothetical protein
MKPPALLLLMVVALFSLMLCAQTEKDQASKISKPSTAASSRSPKAKGARCDSQLGKVCILTIERLVHEEHGRQHLPIGVVKGRTVVWVSEKGNQFKFDRFLPVDCRTEKELENSKGEDPFENPFGQGDKFESVKYSTVIGKIGNCYKHQIEIQGKGKFDPHIIIESP